LRLRKGPITSGEMALEESGRPQRDGHRDLEYGG
jgi:hypothetical protein